MKDRILQKILEFDYESVMRKIHGDSGTTLKNLKRENAAKKAAERAAKLKQQQQPQQQQPQPENSSTDIRNLLINKLSKLVNESKPYQPTQADRDDEESYRAGEEAKRDQGGVDDELDDMAKFYGQGTKKPKPTNKLKPAKREESTNLKDRMVEALAQKLTESPMEFTYRRETPEEKAANKKRAAEIRAEAKAKKKPSGGSKPEADGGEGTKPGSYFTNRHGGRTEN